MFFSEKCVLVTLLAAAWYAVKSYPAENAVSNPETFAVQQIAAGPSFG